MPTYRTRRVHVLVTERLIESDTHAHACAQATRWRTHDATLDRVSVAAKLVPVVSGRATPRRRP